MKRSVTVATCLLIAGLAGISAWQWHTISELESRVLKAEEAATQRPRRSPPVRAPLHSPPGDASPRGKEVASPLVKTSPEDQRRILQKIKDANSAPPASFGPAIVDAAPAVKPPELTPRRKKALLEGRETFSPGPIQESSIPVADQTVLTKGQSLQIKYANTWYAGEVVGFESDGGVHVRYFGWDSSWDEVVPRTDLRIDPQAREHAVEKYGAQAAETQVSSY
jgi:hypothetical protein